MSGVITPAVFISGALSVSTVDGEPSTTLVSSGKTYGGAGELRITTVTAVINMVGGLPMDATGRMVTVPKALITGATSVRTGLLFDITGAVVTVNFLMAVAPLTSQNEVTIDAGGALVINGV